jgi:hypothetical protein
MGILFNSNQNKREKMSHIPPLTIALQVQRFLMGSISYYVFADAHIVEYMKGGVCTYMKNKIVFL